MYSLFGPSPAVYPDPSVMLDPICRRTHGRCTVYVLVRPFPTAPRARACTTIVDRRGCTRAGATRAGARVPVARVPVLACRCPCPCPCPVTVPVPVPVPVPVLACRCRVPVLACRFYACRCSVSWASLQVRASHKQSKHKLRKHKQGGIRVPVQVCTAPASALWPMAATRTTMYLQSSLSMQAAGNRSVLDMARVVPTHPL